jgi:hypothetical protein
VQPGLFERGGVRGEQHAVGRHGQILNGGTRRQAAHQIGHVSAQQRLAAGEAHLVDAERDEHVHQPLDLLEMQDVLARQPGVLRLGHAVAAAEVAPVGDRETQVAQRAGVAVEQH